MSKEKWVVTAKRADFDSISERFGIDKVIARVIRNRDVISDEEIDKFLHGDISAMHDPLLMKDMEKALLVIKDKISEKKKIRVIGDYDVDGICSSYILLKGLKTVGADVDTVIPHRIKDGYGLNDSLIYEAKEDGVDTILTCDNGISAYDQISLANNLGMTVVVTDHHEVPYEMNGDKKEYKIPPAIAIVDPKQEDCLYPFKSICGGMIAFKFIESLLKEVSEVPDTDVIEELIPFAAMATVCDVMELLDENRIIVKEGLKRMSNPVNVGLKALIMATGLGEKTISAYHFGFVLGPTINATGRLDTAQRALELFGSDDYGSALLIATELRELNDSRKKLTEDGTKEASEFIESKGMMSDRVLVVYLPESHESIAGIVAGRLKEKYYKPVLVFTDAEDGVKGSGRSIESYDMYAELSKVGDIFTKFGGHKMAAGMSLAKASDIEVLRERLNENCTLTDEDLVKIIRIDVPMPLYYASADFIRSLDILEPCGTANPKPVFADKNISLLSYEKKGKSRVIGKFIIADEYQNKYDMVYFDDIDAMDEFLIDNFGNETFERLSDGMVGMNEVVVKIIYSPSINSFNNVEKVQFVLKNIDI